MIPGLSTSVFNLHRVDFYNSSPVHCAIIPDFQTIALVGSMRGDIIRSIFTLKDDIKRGQATLKDSY
jgi:hypothetical protein